MQSNMIFNIICIIMLDEQYILFECYKKILKMYSDLTLSTICLKILSLVQET